VPFVRDLLTQAQPAPNPNLAAVVSGPLTEALVQVLSAQMTAEEAAAAAIQSVEVER
jgi:hypothetical protein